MSNCEYKAKIDFQSEMLKKDDFLFKYFDFQTKQKKLESRLISVSATHVNKNVLYQCNE